MSLTILYPDAQHGDGMEIERAVFGSHAQVRALGAQRSDDVPAQAWQSCDAVVCFDFGIAADVIARMERCRQIVRAGVGVDQIDLEAAAARGIPVCNTPDYGTTDVADHAIAMMLALARGIVSYDAALRADPVAGWDFVRAPTVRRLAGLTFGIVGLGRIGTATALRARAFGMDVAFYDPYRPSGTELALGFRRADDLGALLERSDVVSLHAPLTPETRGLIGEAALENVRPDAFLVNTARGAIVDSAAVLDALRKGRLAGAALDVLPQEPPAPGDPLVAAWRSGDPALAGRLLLSPHVAFYSPASLVDIRTKSAKVALDYLRDGVLRNCVNGIAAARPHGW
jgi:lactate dehydrogenase-like 2-hydroxyacid dehydrogenase